LKLRGIRGRNHAGQVELLQGRLDSPTAQSPWQVNPIGKTLPEAIRLECAVGQHGGVIDDLAALIRSLTGYLAHRPSRAAGCAMQLRAPGRDGTGVRRLACGLLPNVLDCFAQALGVDVLHHLPGLPGFTRLGCIPPASQFRAPLSFRFNNLIQNPHPPLTVELVTELS
jgi:hypothetical protein